jgi:hypothetical protein
VTTFAKRCNQEYGSSKLQVYVPFVASLVAEPPVGHKVVDMLEALPPHGGACYSSPSALFVSE